VIHGEHSLDRIGRASGLLAGSSASLAQVSCGVPGPDGMVGGITGFANYAHVGDIDAFSLGATTCNLGSATMVVNASTPAHPILTLNLFEGC
jgi:hypothetical protein